MSRFIVSVVVCFVLIVVGVSDVVDFLAGFVGPRIALAISSFSFMTHFESFQKGLLDSRDVIFFLSVIGFSLFTTGVVLRSRRAG